MGFRCVGPIALALSVAACTSSARLDIVIDGNGHTGPSEGAHSYAIGTAVKVTAVAAENTTFAGWGDAAVGTGNPIVVVVDKDKVLVAHFTANDQSSGSGSTSSSSSGGGSTSSSSSGGSSTSSSSSGGGSTSSSSSGGSSASSSSSSGGSTSSSSSGGGSTSSSSSGGSTSSSSSGGSSGGSSSGAVSTISINAGGGAVGSFVADAHSSGGETYSTTNSIDTSHVTGDVPPASVFQTERFGDLTYTIPDRLPGSAQTVTLFFEESLWTGAGERTFDVAINGTTVLSAFDIYAEAGGQNIAIARTFSTSASAEGRVTIQLASHGGPDHPKICGLSVSGAASNDASPANPGP